MRKWIRYSKNPEDRIRYVSIKYTTKVNCLNCRRILRSEFKLCSNDEGYQTCQCGYTNYFTLVGDHLWEQSIGKSE